MQSSLWTEHKAADGRLYWNNTQTRVSVWERPDELKSPAERALAATPWKEYQTAEGKKYWFHSQTKQTVWELPPEVKAAVDQAVAAAGSPAQANGAGTPLPAVPAQTGPPTGFVPAPVPAGLPQRPAFQAFVPATALPSSGNPYQTIPEFRSVEEAEQAFKDMLREKGVTPQWTWEQTMQQLITEPLFKALETMAQRKAAFESFVESERRSAKEQREKNIAKARPTFKSTLDRLGEKRGPDGQAGPPVRSWWTFERLSKEVEQRAPELWKLSKVDDERKVLWEEYLVEFKRKERVAEESLRDRQRAKLRALLNDPESIGLGPHLENVPWRQGHATLLRSHAIRDDPDLRSMEDLQMLIVWEDEVKRAEREANEIRQRDKEAHRRSGRKARTAFRALLEELKGAGMIRAGTLWKEIYPSIERDERFTDLLGMDGSSPLDLFWDAVDEFDAKVEGLERVVAQVLEAKGKVVEEQTELSDFREWVRGAEQLEGRSDRDLKAVFLNVRPFSVQNAGR